VFGLLGHRLLARPAGHRLALEWQRQSADWYAALRLWIANCSISG